MATHFFQDLAVSWLNPDSKIMENLSGFLKILFWNVTGSWIFVATHFFQDLWISWLNPDWKAMIIFTGSLKILFWILTGSRNSVATRFFQDLLVSSGKISESLQDPSRIRDGSSPESSKTSPRVGKFYLKAISF